ncbi:hypothetical protein ONS95_006190 [Cadophora gregata]|uniref:uncharacterized protein n=1 Tax=Cadophora gregata TaxID=51156 RepID=UPI0026DBC601|nr:uncharacterized protein ONS95_006190 [Cadophora gregata]KAK0102580.1 hypothetical protein ONS95_006190 [Cadophora gregata]
MRVTRSASKHAKAIEQHSAVSPHSTNDTNSIPTNAITTKFTVFPKLPLEIRQMIWVLSLEPRIIEICIGDASDFYSKAKLPAALQVSKESRGTVNSQYSLCFGSTSYPAQTLFNFNLDTLYFDRSKAEYAGWFFCSLRDFELANLQTVAIDMYIEEVASTWGLPFNAMDEICKVLQLMPKLTTLLAVYETQHYMDRNMWSMDMAMDFGWMESNQDTSMIQFYDDAPAEFDAYIRRNEKNYFGFDNMIPEWPFYGDYDDFPFFTVYGMRRSTKERVIQKNLAETSEGTKTSRPTRRGRQKRVA